MLVDPAVATGETENSRSGATGPPVRSAPSLTQATLGGKPSLAARSGGAAGSLAGDRNAFQRPFDSGDRVALCSPANNPSTPIGESWSAACVGRWEENP